MDTILQLIKIEGYEDMKDILINFKKDLFRLIKEIENENNLIKLKHKIHTLKGFFSNKKIIKLLLKIKYESDINKIKILFEKVKKLIYKELEKFNKFI